MADLAPFALSDMIAASAALRAADRDATSMEGAAATIVSYLHEHLVDKGTGDPACALIRFYKTHTCDRLPADLQRAARAALSEEDGEAGNCLALLATAGVEPAWNDRRSSGNDRAIPLASGALRRLPLMAALVSAVGPHASPLVAEMGDPPATGELDRRQLEVLHVADAVGSPVVPDQDGFVVPYGIKSVVGFGGGLPSGSVFAVVLFTTVAISPESAGLLGSLSLAIKLGILPFDGGRVFSDDPPMALSAPTGRSLASRVAALTELLEAREQVVGAQAARLESALAAVEERSDQIARSLADLAASEARHQALVDASIDAVITMDQHGKVLSFNPAAARIFGYEPHAAIGRPLDELIIPPSLRARHRQGLHRYLQGGSSSILGRHVELIGMRSDGAEFPVELTVTEIHVPGAVRTFSGTVRDITGAKEAERRLREARLHAARVARTLQASLLPPRLPEIPGVELGSRYHPAGEGSEIGGDFYDVFQTGKDDWALVLGDVCGKGAEAATVTALARHTLRAAAVRMRRPSAVLAVLNEALITQHIDRYCTLVYIRLRRRDETRIRVSIACGGHPRPLLLDPDGTTAPVGGSGMLVGVLPDATFSDQSLYLPPDCTLVAFTDGLTEARRDGEFFGDRRLHQVLAELAGAPAPEVAEALERAVLDFQGGQASDDLAILTVRHS